VHALPTSTARFNSILNSSPFLCIPFTVLYSSSTALESIYSCTY
jgi:hypothetical protein